MLYRLHNVGNIYKYDILQAIYTLKCQTSTFRNDLCYSMLLEQNVPQIFSYVGSVNININFPNGLSTK